VICGNGDGYVVLGIGEGLGDWSWHSDSASNKMEVAPGCGLDDFFEEIAKDMMGSMANEIVATTLND
jgi:hypothetical protein